MKITLNGQSFEVPIDVSVLQGFGVGMPLRGINIGPQPMSLPQQSAQEQPAQVLPAQQETAHRRLENSFFQQVRGDMDAFVRFGMFGREERTSRAIIALHSRLRRLENICNVKGSSVPLEQEVTKQEVVKANPNLAEFVKTLMKNIKPLTPQEVAKPEAKPVKPKPKAKPKAKATKPKKSITKKKS